LNLGDVSLQGFGTDTDVLIRIQRQEGDEKAQIAAIKAVTDMLGSDFDIRRTEFVGPTVGAELAEKGVLAVICALMAILVYIWFRFEWQFSIAAILALAHDVLTTIGLFSLTAFEFNLATVAAILTIAGYSINDTVVVFDRVRENLRRYKSFEQRDILNRSLNETLSRTVMTSVTTLLALTAIVIFGGAVLRDFALAMIWGVIIGTYSSVFIAVGMLSRFDLKRVDQDDDGVEVPEYER
jgi:preprotein translocase SecF subunit